MQNNLLHANPFNNKFSNTTSKNYLLITNPLLRIQSKSSIVDNKLLKSNVYFKGL